MKINKKKIISPSNAMNVGYHVQWWWCICVRIKKFIPQNDFFSHILLRHFQFLSHEIEWMSWWSQLLYNFILEKKFIVDYSPFSINFILYCHFFTTHSINWWALQFPQSSLDHVWVDFMNYCPRRKYVLKGACNWGIRKEVLVLF